MKTKACIAILAVFVMSIATPWMTSAHASGPSASGTYRFVMEDGPTKQVEFNATTDERGVTTGQMTYRDEGGTLDWDPDTDPEPPREPSSEFYITAELDSLTIENNRAVMGGTVRESSNQSFVGSWVQLVVEDNREEIEGPDKVSWCFCTPEPGGWVPVDAEDPHDQGVYLTWWATDEERRDDYGMPSPNLMPGIARGCPAIQLSSYDFPETRGEGQIQVQP